MDIVIIAVVVSAVLLILIWIMKSMGLLVSRKPGETSSSRRARQLYQDAPQWLSLDPAKLQPGQEYCRLRADWVDVNPVRSEVTATYASLSGKRSERLADRMTFEDFVQLENRFIAEGWQKAFSRNDKEGETVYFMRKS